MNRIDETFKKLHELKHKAFISYISAGDPNLDVTLRIMKSLSDLKVDIIELGVPFSDPIGDGPVNQGGAQRGIASHTTLLKILEMVKIFRKNYQTPIVLFSYMNPIVQIGYSNFAEIAHKAGIDAVLTVDSPFDMNTELEKYLSVNDIYPIYLASPTTANDRLSIISKKTKGFLYYISSLGVTGERTSFSKNLKSRIKEIKSHTQTPVCVGFGISKPEQAKEISKYADGIIIGSAFVKIIAENLKNENKIVDDISKFAKSIINAIKN